MNEPQKITVQVGSTKVYADLGYAGAAEMQRKSRLAGEIARAVKARLIDSLYAHHLHQSIGTVPCRIGESKFLKNSPPTSTSTHQIQKTGYSRHLMGFNTNLSIKKWRTKILRAKRGERPDLQVSFIVGGAQKSGTTALDFFLRQHPEICMPHTGKEIHFFDNEKNFINKLDYDEYHCHFRPLQGHRVIGETTPIYMYWDPAPSRIWSYNPNMKWVLILRNPVDRAHSGWKMERKRQVDPLPFADAVARETERCSVALPLQHRVFSYLDRGYYAHQVRRLFRIFGRKNCLIILSEDLATDHAATLRRVFEFLGVDPNVTPPAEKVFESAYPDELDKKLRARLIDLFYFDIRELENLLGRDLSAWNS